MTTQPIQLDIRELSTRRLVLVGTFVFALSLSARLLHFGQGLWCDEMSTLLDYVTAPWHTILAAEPGQYVPNNHVLYTILAKLFLLLGAAGRIDPVSRATVLVRIPALLAGALVPIALAWPYRRSTPLAALLLALVASVHPWFIAFSDEARGYALMLLLGVFATNLLPDQSQRWPIAYALALAAAIYTVAVAILLVIGHGLAMLVLRRQAFSNWLRAAGLAMAIAILLYLPMGRALVFYYRHPLPSPDNFGDFINQLFRFSLAGQYLPTPVDPARYVPDIAVGIGYWLLPVGLLVIGLALGLRNAALKPLTTAMGAATATALCVPVLVPAAGQVRFAPWAGVLLCVGIVAIVFWIHIRFGPTTMAVVAFAIVGWLIWLDITLPDNQPVAEAIRWTDADAPKNADIVVAFLTAKESVALYQHEAIRHPLLAADSPPAFFETEAARVRATGHRPWLIISYECLIHDIQPAVWDYLNMNYKVVNRLPGRISPVAVYSPRDWSG